MAWMFATVHDFEDSAYTRFHFYREGSLPSTAYVVQKTREGNFIKDHNVTFTIDGDGVFFDIIVVGDVLVSLNTGESKLFEFDSLENHDDGYGGPGYDNGYNDYPFADAFDEYDYGSDDYSDYDDYNDDYGKEALSKIVPPLAKRRNYFNDGTIITVPWVGYNTTFVKILDSTGNTVEPHKPYWWYEGRYVVFNGIACMEIDISDEVELLTDFGESSQYTDSSYTYACVIGQNPFVNPKVKIVQKDSYYDKEYGDKFG